MSTWTDALLRLTLALTVAGCLHAPAQAATHPRPVDDGLDLVDVEALDRSRTAPDLEPLVEGLGPADLEPTLTEPDDLGTIEPKGASPKSGTGPMVGTNTITITVAADDANAGSGTDFIYVRFGQRDGDSDGSEPYQVKLMGQRNGADYSFPLGATITWDLEQVRDYLEGVPQDSWDQISFVTPSGDGLLIARVRVVHSGVEILDWAVDRWLDYPDETTLGCAAKITERKLAQVGNSDHAAIHFGALDLGKTNGSKYGGGALWCSEFASWALWKEGFMTPAGSIGTDDMKAWFSDRDRLFTRAQVKSKTYVPRQGDYLSINDGGHSCLFLEWVDPTSSIADATRFRTLDGNSGQRVRIVTRTVAEIDAVGKAQ